LIKYLTNLTKKERKQHVYLSVDDTLELVAMRLKEQGKVRDLASRSSEHK